MVLPWEDNRITNKKKNFGNTILLNNRQERNDKMPKKFNYLQEVVEFLSISLLFCIIEKA